MNDFIRLSLLPVEEFCQQPVPFGMAAYFQDRIQQHGDVYRPGHSAWRKPDCWFRLYVPFPSHCGHGHPHGCRRCACCKCLVHGSFCFNCEYSGFGSPLNYKGPTANAFGKARLSGKIPQRSEDDFFRNRKARPCRPKRSACQLCPVVPGWQACFSIFFFPLFLPLPSVPFP